MEEILASIRRIISEDANEGDAKDAPAAGEAKAAASKPEPEPEPQEEEAELLEDEVVAEVEEDDVLELTEIVESVPEPEPEPEPVAVAPEPTPPPPAPKPKPAPISHQEPAESDLMLVEKEDDQGPALVSAAASSKGGSAFGALAQNLKIASIDSRTLEDVVHDLIKPMLKDWLERNLPDTVERLVQEEIDKMAKRGRR
ncbi:MAG: DUF2497 domain-containing protein [Alphaproteobacteria bacterium]|nr:DUF2497 domain-containing protein [Alphaproteobacteria bacterium]